MAELSDALHELYDAEVSVQVAPARGMNVLTSDARSARRRGQVRLGAIAACGALLLGAGIVGGAMALRIDAVQPSSSTTPDPSPTTVSVTFDASAAVAEATSGFTVPECGDVWSPEPTSVGAVTVHPQVLHEPGADDGPDSITVATAFPPTGPPIKFLSDPYGFVVTQHGVVVATSLTFENLGLRGMASDASTIATLVGSATCAAEQDIAAAWESVGLEPDATEGLTDEEQAAIQPQLDELRPKLEKVMAEHAKLEPGSYQVYAVSPVIFGAQLLAAEQIAATGYANVGIIESDLGSTEFRNDPRVSPYCTGSDGNGYCDVPEDVLREVLTFEVDSGEIDTTPSGIAISAPVTVSVP